MRIAVGQITKNEAKEGTISPLINAVKPVSHTINLQLLNIKLFVTQ